MWEPGCANTSNTGAPGEKDEAGQYLNHPVQSDPGEEIQQLSDGLLAGGRKFLLIKGTNATEG